MSLRVLYLLEHPTLLGGERSWLATLRRLGGRVEPLAVARPAGPLADRLRQEGIARVPFDWPRGDPERRCQALLDALGAQVAVQLVHANSLTTSLLAAQLGRALGVPAVGHARDIMRLSRARVERLNRLDRLLCVSRAAADALRDQGVAPGVLAVVPNGVDAAAGLCPARHSPTRLPRELGLPASAPRVGFVGQLVLRKDPLTFLRAFRDVARRRADAQAVVVGARHSGKDEALAYEASLHEQVRAAGLERRVHFLGERDDVPSVLASLSVLVNTSRQEPLGRVLLEAMAMSVPVVATRVGGTPEILTDEVDGLLVPADAPSACAEAILRLLDDPPLARRLGAAGRARALEAFTPEACADGWAGVYDALVPARGR